MTAHNAARPKFEYQWQNIQVDVTKQYMLWIVQLETCIYTHCVLRKLNLCIEVVQVSHTFVVCPWITLAWRGVGAQGLFSIYA